MANNYYSISAVSFIADIKAALAAKFSGGITFHYESTAYLIFSCTALSNKVIKINWFSSSAVMYYGDAYSSGTTITNQVAFFGYTGAVSEAHLVLGVNTFLLTTLQTTLNSCIGIIGKLDNDDYAVMGTCGSSNATYCSISIGRNTTDNVGLVLVAWENPFASGNGKLYKQKVILRRTDGAIEEKTDGSISTFQDVFNSSHATSVTSLVKGANYLLTPTYQYMSDAILRLRTSLIMEF